MKYVNCTGMMRKSAYLSHDTSINIDHIASFKYTFRDSPRGGRGQGRFDHEQKNVYSRLNHYIVRYDLIALLDSLKTVRGGCLKIKHFELFIFFYNASTEVTPEKLVMFKKTLFDHPK